MDEVQRENKKSFVRVLITYIAAGFLFIGGALLITYLLLEGEDNSEAITVFNTLLPVATGIVSFWFAGRGQQKNKP